MIDNKKTKLGASKDDRRCLRLGNKILPVPVVCVLAPRGTRLGYGVFRRGLVIVQIVEAGCAVSILSN